MSTGTPRDQEELAWRGTRDSGGGGGQGDDEDLDWIRYLTGGGSGPSDDSSPDDGPRRSVRARFASRKPSGGPEASADDRPEAEAPRRGRGRGRAADPEPEPQREDRGRGQQRRGDRHRADAGSAGPTGAHDTGWPDPRGGGGQRSGWASDPREVAPRQPQASQDAGWGYSDQGWGGSRPEADSPSAGPPGFRPDLSQGTAADAPDP